MNSRSGSAAGAKRRSAAAAPQPAEVSSESRIEVAKKNRPKAPRDEVARETEREETSEPRRKMQRKARGEEPKIILEEAEVEAEHDPAGKEKSGGKDRRFRKWIRKNKMNAAADFFAMCDPRLKIRPPPRVPLRVAKELNLFETKSAEGRRAYKRYEHQFKKAMLALLERVSPDFRKDVDIYGWMENLTAQNWKDFKTGCSLLTDPNDAPRALLRDFMDGGRYDREDYSSTDSSDSELSDSELSDSELSDSELSDSSSSSSSSSFSSSESDT